LAFRASRNPPPSFRTEQGDCFFRFRSCESVALRREKSLCLLPRPAHKGPLHHRCESGSDESLLGGWLTPDPLGSFWVPHPFTTLVKGAGVEFDFAARPSFH